MSSTSLVDDNDIDKSNPNDYEDEDITESEGK